MSSNYLLLCVFGISACLLAGAVAREALVGGQRALDNEFPYQVSVLIRGDSHDCSGGIIDNKFVLTAAHCVLNHDRHLISTQVSVIAGTVDLHGTRQGAVFARVDRIFIPSQYRPGAHVNFGDIAVLWLRDPLLLGRGSQLQKLQLAHGIDVHRAARLAGFGWNIIRNISGTIVGTSDSRLYNAEADVLSVASCESAYGLSLGNTYLCARIRPYSAIAGACIGDSGSPLVHRGVVIGILSKISPNCNEEFKPAIYTRVSVMRRMISNILEYHYDPHMTVLQL